MKLKRELCASRRKLSQQAGWTIASMLAAYMVLSFYNFHERSEFTSIFTSTLTSETSVIRLLKLQKYNNFSNNATSFPFFFLLLCCSE